MPFTAQKQNTESVGIPAPIKGIVATGVYSAANATSGSGAEGATGVDSAIWLFNMVAGEYGCRVRPGSREFATNIPDSINPDGVVRSVLFYNSIVSGGVQDHIFAITDTGIFDITAGGAGPWVLGDRASDFTWPNQGGEAGWTTAINYTNVNGDHFLLVTDEDNGYYIFDGTSWAVGTFTGSPTPLAGNLVQISEWNGRIWFVEKNTARAWFLDPLALTGSITVFDIGSRLKTGGHLVQCTTWTMDAGDGMDDKFVMVSASGDVLIWSGIDPTVASDLTLIGRWQIGTVPEGRKVMSDWGGDTIILSASGLVTVSALLSGTSNLDSSRSVSRNINQYIRTEMQLSLDQFGWQMQMVPKQGIVIITVPQPLNSTRAPIQFVVESTTHAWSMFRDLDMVSVTKRGSDFMFSTSNGRVMLLDGTLDNISLDGLTGEAIVFSLMTHYSGGGAAANWKRAQFIRPYWIGTTRPIFSIAVKYDFDLVELLTSPAYVATSLSLWDAAIWDSDVWEGSAQSYLETIGLTGMGRHVAIAIRGVASTDLAYVGADVMFDKGGML